MKSKILLIVIIIFFAAAAGIYFNKDQLISYFFQPTKSSLQQGIANQQQNIENIIISANNLEIPWELAFLTSGQMLITERPGTLYLMSQEIKIPIEGVENSGEGGLLGMAIHPDFENNNFIYLYLTASQGGQTINRVDRYKLDGRILSDRTEIIGNIPGANYHDGGRIAFGPDGKLYITTGDAGNSNLAQDIDSLAGKILRINDDGSIPNDNPFGNAVYSYGHRNAQGLAWDDQGRLWATEHGRSGVLSGFDEINLIEKGANYGWPIIQGDEWQEGMKRPMAHSGPDETWAPAGMVFYDGRLFYTGLRGQSLYEAVLNQDGIEVIRQHFSGQWGRLRAIALGPDGYFYISTSNRDGRGEINLGDDKIIKINPAIFQPNN